MSPEARVGLAIVVAFTLVVATVLFLRGGQLLAPGGYDLTILFRNAGGVAVGADIRVAGVKVGRIRTVTLRADSQAAVVIRVDPDVRIPQGSRFRVASAGLLGDLLITVTPGPPDAPPIPPGAEVAGEDPFTIESLSDRFREVVDQFEKLAGNLSAIAADPQMQQSLRQALRNAEEATAIARQAAVNFERGTRRVQTLIATDGAAVVRDMRRASTILVETAERLQGVVERETREDGLTRDLRATAASMRQASQRIDRMAADLQGLINPESVDKARQTIDEARQTVGEARQTVGEARQAVQETRAVVQRVQQVVDRADRLLPARLPLPSLPGVPSLIRLDYEVWYADRRAGHGIDLSLFPEAERFYRLGLHDIGGANAIVLQTGQRLTPSLAWRVGVFDSQVGVGVDVRPFEPLVLSMELYDLNELTMDAAARLQVLPAWRITLGGRDLLKDPSLLFGIGRRF